MDFKAPFHHTFFLELNHVLRLAVQSAISVRMAEKRQDTKHRTPQTHFIRTQNRGRIFSLRVSLVKDSCPLFVDQMTEAFKK